MADNTAAGEDGRSWSRKPTGHIVSTVRKQSEQRKWAEGRSAPNNPVPPGRCLICTTPPNSTTFSYNIPPPGPNIETHESMRDIFHSNQINQHLIFLWLFFPFLGPSLARSIPHRSGGLYWNSSGEQKQKSEYRFKGD